MLEKIDLWLFMPSLLLSVLGLLVVFSLSPQTFQNQLFTLGLSLLIFVIVVKCDSLFFQTLAWIFYGVSLVLLVATALLGDPLRGSLRWLDVGFLQFQPSEIVKPLLAVAFALLATRLSLSKTKDFLKFLLFFLPPFFLIFFQPDLGSALVLGSLWSGIVLTKGINFKIIMVGLLFLAVSVPLLVFLLKPYQKQRFEAFFDPKADPLGSSYNQIQARIAVGSGKFMGKGLGRGVQAHLNFLPEDQTDFIFAAFAEEFGFLGSCLLLSLYGMIFLRLIYLAEKVEKEFCRLLIMGLFSYLSFQTLVHVGMNIGLLPVTGVTLPFISVGGTSLLSTWVGLSIASAVGGEVRKQTGLEIG